MRRTRTICGSTTRVRRCSSSGLCGPQHRNNMGRTTLPKIAAWGLALLIVNSGYLAAFAHASIFYEANVLLHLGLGLALAAAAIRWIRRYPEPCGAFLLSAIPATYLAIRGNTSPHRWVLWLHIA